MIGEERIRRLEREIEKLKGMIAPIDLHMQAKMKLINAIKKHKKFRSKKQWARHAKHGYILSVRKRSD